MIKFSRKQLRIPYLIFLLVFVVLPLFVILYYALTNGEGQFTWGNFREFFVDGKTMGTLFYSLMIAVTTTIVCLLIAYPTAYILARGNLKRGPVYVILLVMPMWINFVLRTAATRDLLYWVGLDGGNHPYIATMIGMVYNYLPFTILPLYTTMIKMDKSLIDASYDLGANPVQTFFKTQIPLTMPGIISGAMMVFMPTMSSFVISDVMGERKIQLIGNTIQFNFDQMRWHEGSFIAFIMLVIIGISMLLTRNVKKEENARGGLW